MGDAETRFNTAVSREVLERVAEKLRARNIVVRIVAGATEARQAVLEWLPPGAEIHVGKSKTLQDIGVIDELAVEEKYHFLRNVYLKMDRATQMREIRKLIAAPDFMVGSVNAVTEDGVLVASSATASQIGPYASGAGKVLFVVGSQKIVANLEEALRRIREYVLPWEDAQVRPKVPTGSFVGKTLLIEKEWIAGRIEVIFVEERVGM